MPKADTSFHPGESRPAAPSPGGVGRAWRRARLPLLLLCLHLLQSGNVAAQSATHTADTHREVFRAQPPDPRPPASFHFRERLIIDAWSLRSPSNQVLERREVRNQIDMAWVSSSVLGVVGGRFAFDATLPSTPSHPLIAERQNEPELLRAYLQWQALPGLRLTLGRHDLLSDAGLARLDGASARAAGRDWTVGFAAGLRPNDQLNLIDGRAYLPDTELPEDTGFLAHTLLIEGDLGASARHVALHAAVRSEMSLDRDFVDGTTLALSGRAGTLNRTRLEGSMRAHVQSMTLERAELALILPVGESSQLSVGGLHSEPRFPASSIFSVFPQTLHDEVRLAWSTTVSQVRIHAAALGRANRASDAPGTTPDLRAGGELSLSGNTRSGRLRLQGRLSALGSPHADSASAGFYATVTPLRGPRWQFSQSLATQRLERSGLGRRTGAYLSAGVQGTLGLWALLSLNATMGWDDRTGLHSRVLASAEITLPGAIR